MYCLLSSYISSATLSYKLGGQLGRKFPRCWEESSVALHLKSPENPQNTV